MKNAKQVFNAVNYSLQNNRILKKLCKVKKGDNALSIYNKDRNSTFRSLPNNPENAEGENASVVILDECWAVQKNDKMFRAVSSATKARQNSLILAISTAGNNVETWWYSLVVKGRNILKGLDNDYRCLPMLFESEHISEDELAKPEKLIEAARASNPAMGSGSSNPFTEEAFIERFELSKHTRADYIDFLQRNLNRWVSDSQSWLPLDLIKKCIKSIPPEELKEDPLFLGMDLSTSGSDTSCVADCFKRPNNCYHFVCKSWVCKEGVRRRNASALPSYSQYGDWLEMVEEETVPQERVRDYIVSKLDLNLQCLVTDQYNAELLCRELANGHGINSFRQGQGYADYTWSMKSFEQAMREGRITFEPNDLVTYQLQNVAIDIDANANCRPSKKKTKGGTVDSVVAMLMAYGKAAGDVEAFESGSLFA